MTVIHRTMLLAIGLIALVGLTGSQPWEPVFPDPEDPCRVQRTLASGRADLWVHEYDEQGRRIRSRSYEGDRAGGPIQWGVDITWDEAGRHQTLREVSETGEPLNRYETRTNDDSGRLVERARHGAERVYQREAWTYDASGRLTQHREHQTDDPDWDFGSDYEYDEQGRVVARTYGWFPDEFPARQWRLTYKQDGRRAVVVRSRLSDGRIHSMENLTFDADGRLIRSESPATRVGDTTAVNAYTYDPSGRLVEVDHRNERAESHERVAFTYDDAGRLTQRQDFHGGSDEPAATTVYDYGCWSAGGE